MAAPLPKGVAVHSTIPGVERLRLNNSNNSNMTTNESAHGNTMAKRSSGGRRNRRCRYRRPTNPIHKAHQQNPIVTRDTRLYDKAFPPLRTIPTSMDSKDAVAPVAVSTSQKMILVQLLRGVSRVQEALRSPDLSYSTAAKAPPPPPAPKQDVASRHRYTSFFKVPQFSPSAVRQRILPKRLRMSRLNRKFRKALIRAFALVENKGDASLPRLQSSNKALTVSPERLARTPRMTSPAKSATHQQ